MRRNRRAVPQTAAARQTRRPDTKTAFLCDELRILDRDLAHTYIRERQERGIDRDDEVMGWCLRLWPVFLFEAVQTRILEAAQLADMDSTFQSLRNLNTHEDYQTALHQIEQPV